MKYSITHKIINEVRLLDPFPVKCANSIFTVLSEDNLMKSVTVTFEKVPITIAPHLLENQTYGGLEPAPKLHIHSPINPFFAHAQNLIRSWQAVLAPLCLIEIDFDHYSEEFFAEAGEAVDIPKFSTESQTRVSGFRDFTIYARAFDAALECADLVEPTTFFIEGTISQREERFVHAYNSFYLVLESLYANGKYKTNEVVRELMKSQEVLNSLQSVISNDANLIVTNNSPLPFNLSTMQDVEQVLRGIVSLRGRLRHHSSKNKRRWNPSDQSQFKGEVALISALCRKLLSERSIDEIFEQQRLEKIMVQAEQAGMKTVWNVYATYLRIGIPTTDQIMQISVPKRTPDSQVALVILERAIRKINERAPEEAFINIKANDAESGAELFRYELAGSVVANLRD